MRFKLILFLIFLGIIKCYSQDKNTRSDTLRVVKLDAEEFASKALGLSKDSLSVLLQGAKYIEGEYGVTDIYYIYSKEEKKNIPVEFSYIEKDERLYVWSITFVSRESHYYKPADLRTAFWIEYIRNPYIGN